MGLQRQVPNSQPKPPCPWLDFVFSIQTAEKSSKAIRGLFEEQHERLYGHRQEENEIEISKARLAGILAIAHPPILKRGGLMKSPTPVEHRSVYLDEENGFQVTPIYHGAELDAGVHLNGPLIVDEETTTIFVGAKDKLHVDPVGNYIIKFE